MTSENSKAESRFFIHAAWADPDIIVASDSQGFLGFWKQGFNDYDFAEDVDLSEIDFFAAPSD